MSKVSTLFASIAVALGHLRSTTDNKLFDDQKREIDEAVVALRDAEGHIGEMIREDVAEAVDAELAAKLGPLTDALQAKLDALSARIDTTDADFADFKIAVEDGLAGINSAIEQLSPPAAEDPGAGGSPAADPGGAAEQPGTGTSAGGSAGGETAQPAGGQTEDPAAGGDVGADPAGVADAVNDGPAAGADTEAGADAGLGESQAGVGTGDGDDLGGDGSGLAEAGNDQVG
jgi:hypothetical protein